MDAILNVVGRALTLSPGAYGELFEDRCTVTQMTQQQVFDDDGRFCGRESRPVKHPMWWYADAKDGGRLFCTYSGYAHIIAQELRDRGIKVQVSELVDDGLGPPDISQVKHVTWRTRQKSVFTRILAYRRGLIDCPVGWGKTYLAQQLTRVWPQAEIVLTVPFGDVMLETYDTLCREMGPHRVGIVGKGRCKPNRLTVCTAQSLHKLSKDVNLILADESHAMCSANYVKKFNKFHRARLIGFSASHERDDGADEFSTALFGPVIARVEYGEAVDGGNVVPLRVRMHRVRNGPSLSGLSDQTYVNRVGIWRNDQRNDLITHVVRELEKEFGPEAQILIMGAVLEHVCALKQRLPEYTLVTGEPEPKRVQKLKKDGIWPGDEPPCTDAMRQEARRAFAMNELKRVIVTKIWRQGVNFNDLAILVRIDGLASGTDATQIPGRLSRLPNQSGKEYGLLVDFMDEFSENLKRRAYKRRSCYKKHGWHVEVI